jgi:DNA mismatch repair protein MutL
MSKIHQLSPQLINQIAAGEVVERPASVAKELLENALDAKARHIRIDVEYGGVRLLRVSDDGEGMEKEDLLIATSAHTTSKIRTEKDLHAIGSLGFRGEALASIASISRLQIQSCARGSAEAWKIFCKENESSVSIEPCSHPAGTTVEVRDLFYSTPARRKFLRSDKTEFSHIEALVKNLALSHFEVGFELQHNQRLVYQLKPADNEQEQHRRIAKLLDNNFLQHAMVIDFSVVGLRLHGWVGLPSFERNQNDWQFFYVNGRMVRDRLLNHAIKQAYQDKLYAGKHPSYILYLETALDALDVNVHPTKHEVRFHDTRLIHDFIFRHVFDALNKEKSQASAMIPSGKPFDFSSLSVQEPKLPYAVAPVSRPSVNIAQSARPPASHTKPHSGRFIMRVTDTIVLAKNEKNLDFVHLGKACYAFVYDQLKRALSRDEVKHQPLLIPENVVLSQCYFDYFSKCQTVLAKVGIDFHKTSEKTLLVRRLPTLLKKVNVKKLFLRIAEMNLPLDNMVEDQKIQHAFLHSLAESVSEMGFFSDSAAELEKFLLDCHGIEDSYAKNTFKAAVHTLTLAQIEKMHSEL